MKNREKRWTGLAITAAGLTVAFAPVYAAEPLAAELKKLPPLSATCIVDVELALAKSDAAGLRKLFVPGETARRVGEIFEVSGKLDQVRPARGLVDGNTDGRFAHRQFALMAKEHASGYLATWFAAESPKLGPVRIQVGYVPSEPCRVMGVWVNFDVKRAAASAAALP